jgi:hypothetical protein
MILLTLKESNPGLNFECDHKMVYENKVIFGRIF